VGAEAYVANRDPAEEAEVVIVKPRTSSGAPRRRETAVRNPLRRLLKAWRGD
jgi:hypothetical protein